jgi:hypothetical protein
MKTKRKPPAAAWKPGQSGNPNGRAKGSINAATRLRKMIDVEGIITKLQSAALTGDVQSARTLLERALPPLRAIAEPVSVPAAAAAETPTDKAKAIMDAIASGTIPPDIGAQIITALGAMVRVVEIDDLEKRISALESVKGDAP